MDDNVRTTTEQSERKKTDRLTDLGIRKQRRSGFFHDGGGLYLQVTRTGAKTWVLRYMLRGKAREMGLGSYQDVGLAEAREIAKTLRKLRRQGIDPIEHRNAQRKAQTREIAQSKTFAECRDGWVEANEDGWSERYGRDLRTQIENYVIPVIGDLAAANVDTEHVLKILKPIWTTKHVTAQRVRMNVENILDWARVKGFRSGDNPARWEGHVEVLVAKSDKVHTVEHRAALPYNDILKFMTSLRKLKGRDADALELLILTAARMGEIEGASWEEVDSKEKVWSIPGVRMKSGKEHRIPLSGAVIAVLDRIDQRSGRRVGLLFPKVSNKSVEKIRDSIAVPMGHEAITTHGFRSTFRDWAAEKTSFQHEICEKALAHTVRDETVRAYQRGDLLERRRELMTAWANYCDGKNADNMMSLDEHRTKGAA